MFGNVSDEKMCLNHAGEMIRYWIIELENHFKYIYVDSNIIMPNHMHLIIANNVGEDRCLSAVVETKADVLSSVNALKPGAHTGAPLQRTNISEVVQWFKTMTTNEYIRNVKENNWNRYEGKLWQKSFYDHVIRDESDYLRIREYIDNNIVKWEEDEYYL